MYKLVKRQQRIKDLLASLPDSAPPSKKKLHVIDQAYRHPYFSQLGPTQKEILNLTLNDLIDNEKKQIAGKLIEEQQADSQQMQRKLQNYVYSKTPTKSLHLQSSPHLTAHLNLHHILQENRVYIERKYNHKLCYQLHSIMQATDIEDHVNHIKTQLVNQDSSPLIVQLQKHTQTDVQEYTGVAAKRGSTRKTHRPRLKENNFMGVPRATEGKLQLLSEGYKRPIVPNQALALKKYTSTSYGSQTTKTSPKK